MVKVMPTTVIWYGSACLCYCCSSLSPRMRATRSSRAVSKETASLIDFLKIAVKFLFSRGLGTLSTCEISLVSIIALFNIWSNLSATVAGGAGLAHPSGQRASSGPSRPGICSGGARARAAAALALVCFWIIHGLRLLEINIMNGNKKLIKNFPNCFQVRLMGHRQPSLSPTPKSGGPTGLGSGWEGSGALSGPALLWPRERLRVQPRGAAAFPPAAAVRRQPLSPARLRTSGRWGWRVPFQTTGGADWVRIGSQEGTRPPSTRAGCFLCRGEHPPTRGRLRRESQVPRARALAERQRCARSAPLRRRPEIRGPAEASSCRRPQLLTAGETATGGRAPAGTWPGGGGPELVNSPRPGFPGACAGVEGGAWAAGSAGRRGRARRAGSAPSPHMRVTCAESRRSERWAGVPRLVTRRSRRSSPNLQVPRSTSWKGKGPVSRRG